MQEITNALQDLAKAVNNNDIVKKVIVKIEFVKPKPSKAKPESSK